MMNQDFFKWPRLFVTQPLKAQNRIELAASQAHYLKSVLRKQTGDKVRLFNGRDGEWVGTLVALEKKSASVILEDCLKPQTESTQSIHLYFTPIKKSRMDWMIEKGVELGVTDFHPILTQNTDIRKLNADRLEAQIFEAAEQCERLTIPTLHPLQKMERALADHPASIPLFACLERFEAQAPSQQKSDFALLIGPEGGFTQDEKSALSKKAHALTLGETVYRCETAMMKALILLQGYPQA